MITQHIQTAAAPPSFFRQARQPTGLCWHDGGTAPAALADADDAAPWAQDALVWATSAGVLKGGDGKLLPTASTTRAQAAQILTNYLAWAEQ